ncbi:MAG TPA: SDR family NAD(P)-dependent oxidoreductase, partial [Casimicrobiaceae bacterium]|nr:SDR family NAD(P)-dependent oxidoreductase [Casimicrobiaceae bacterium]
MNLQLDGLRVLITAGASGIGLATARAFVREGARVYITDVDREALGQVARSDPALITGVCDVSDRAQVAS